MCFLFNRTTHQVFVTYLTYPGTEGTNHNRHWNHYCWNETYSLEWTRLSCWCLYNHKGCTYRAPVRYVTKTWSVVLLNKKTHTLLCQVFCVWQIVKTSKNISNNTVEWQSAKKYLQASFMEAVWVNITVLDTEGDAHIKYSNEYVIHINKWHRVWNAKVMGRGWEMKK